MAGRFTPPAETLGELFDRYHIVLNEMPVPGRQHGGARSKIWCPECDGGKEHEKNFFVLVDRDGFGATWHCFRANSCGFSGGGRLKDAPERPQEAPKQYRKPRAEPRPERPSKLVEYYAKFGITVETLEALGIYRTERRMPILTKEGKQVSGQMAYRPVIAFPYVEDGEVVNIKYKAIYDNGRKRFLQEFQAKPTLYNIDSFENFGENDWGIMVEGEDDVAALWQCGWRQVTTLPDGSPDKIKDIKEFDKDNDTDKRYAPLYGEPRVTAIKTWILAGDMDAAGARHHEELARRLGKGRCRLVRWPDGCKDAKETLIKRGVEAVNWAIQNADYYPLEGIYRATEDDISRAWHGINDRRIVTGMQVLDERFALNDAGQLIVCTGISGRGKTTFWNGMAMLYTEQTIREMAADPSRRPFHTVLCSAEMDPLLMSSRLIAQRANKPFHPHSVVPRMSEDEARSHLPWVNKHFSFVRWHDRGTQPTLSWAMARFEEIIRRTGAKLAILDPWQEFDDEFPDRARNHSAWTGKCIQKWIGMAVALRCNIVLIAHPTKLERNKDGSITIPDGENIADSIHFKSRCDIGMTIHRDPDKDEDDMVAWVWKQKDPRFSRYGTSTVRYDTVTHRLHPRPVPVKEDPPVEHWQETDAGA